MGRRKISEILSPLYIGRFCGAFEPWSIGEAFSKQSDDRAEKGSVVQPLNPWDPSYARNAER